jgi:division/cell wall cluster transcriptional repressor MraZ
MDRTEMETDFQHHFGTDDSAVDGKGRLPLSKKKREWLADGFRFMKGDLGVLTIYPEWSFQKKKNWVMSFDEHNEGRQLYQSMVLGSAEGPFVADGEGRVVIPSSLRRDVPLEGALILRGVGEYIEVWPLTEYEKWKTDRENYNRAWRDSVRESIRMMKADALPGSSN